MSPVKGHETEWFGTSVIQGETEKAAIVYVVEERASCQYRRGQSHQYVMGECEEDRLLSDVGGIGHLGHSEN